jgi:photosystem II stability/assembly factor-like uncharacterized protein
VAAVGDNLVWIVDDAGVIRHSEDAGQTWRQQTTPIRIPLGVMTFIDPWNGWVVGGVANSGESGLVVHTSNGGQTWIRQTSGCGDFIWDVDFVNPYRGWLLAQHNYYDGPCLLMSTTDGGVQWDTAAVFPADYRLLAIDFVNPLNGWIVGRSTADSAIVLATTDGGRSWTSQLVNDDTFFGDVCFLDSLEGWVTASYGLLCHTTDGGLSWDCQRQDSALGGLSRIYFSDSRHGWVTTGTGPRSILSTCDGGVTWSRFQPVTASSPGAIASGDSLHVYVAGSAGYIFRSVNSGADWTDVSSRRDWEGIGSGYFADSLHGWLTGARNINGMLEDVIWHTTDGGLSWSTQSQGLSVILHDADFVDSNTGWIVGSNGTVLHTTNAGATWVQQNGLAGEFAVLDFFDHQHGATVSGHTIFSTQDGGETWSQQSSPDWEGLTSVTYADVRNVWAVGFRMVNPDSNIYEGILLHSTDSGGSWTRIPFTENRRLHTISFSDSQTGFITEDYSPGLLRTTDGGETWVDMPSPAFNRLDWVTATSSTDLWAVTEGVQIVRSRDAGLTWSTEPLIYSHGLRKLMVADSNHVWALGGIVNTLFRYGGTISSASERPRAALPASFSVLAYPNPFNPSTTLQFSVNIAGKVDLSIYDLLGQRVVTLVDRVVPAGQYEVRFNGSPYASGLYFARMMSGRETRTHKLLLLK